MIQGIQYVPGQTLRPLLPRTHENQLSEGCPRAPDGLEQTGSPELIPGPRIRSYDARPNSFLNGIGAGRPCTSLGSPPVRPDFAGRQMKVVLLKRIARHGFASAARSQICFLYLTPRSVAWDLRCHEQRPSDPISQTSSRSGGQATADLLL